MLKTVKEVGSIIYGFKFLLPFSFTSKQTIRQS